MCCTLQHQPVEFIGTPDTNRSGPARSRLDNVEVETHQLPLIDMIGTQKDYFLSGHGVSVLV